ncbi:hypothetical protein [Dehalobacterium formicoaceticum]|uniref:hypothetical protein n=1 Tax=Dehalobacterium formicoaceticum TaxID=51515 RepID=UPI000B7ECFB8|nr:hypothetical protein [Dehalobacterium formicoaceticum]
MEKILTIDGRQVKFKSTGAFLLKYKAQFGRDALQDLYKLQTAIDKNNEIINVEALDLEVMYNIAWSLAKTADPSLPPPIEWLDTFSEFPLNDIIPELQEMIQRCLSSTVSSKKKA